MVRGQRDCQIPPPPPIRNKQIEAVTQYPSLIFPSPIFIALPMELNVPKTGCCHMSEFMTTRSAATGCPFPRPIPTKDNFMHTWKEMAKPLGWGPPVSVALSWCWLVSFGAGWSFVVLGVLLLRWLVYFGASWAILMLVVWCWCWLVFFGGGFFVLMLGYQLGRQD